MQIFRRAPWSIIVSHMDSPLDDGRDVKAGGTEPSTSALVEKDLPRWVQIPVGIALGLLTLFCAFASVSLLVMPRKESPAPVLAFGVGLVLLAGCAWILEKCFRLITGQKKRGGLLSPKVLRVVAGCMLLLPFSALFTGYYREMGAVAIFQAAMYFIGFFGLRALAAKREAAEASRDQTQERSE
jgi:hypothetical protein